MFPTGIDRSGNHRSSAPTCSIAAASRLDNSVPNGMGVKRKGAAADAAAGSSRPLPRGPSHNCSGLDCFAGPAPPFYTLSGASWGVAKEHSALDLDQAWSVLPSSSPHQPSGFPPQLAPSFKHRFPHTRLPAFQPLAIQPVHLSLTLPVGNFQSFINLLGLETFQRFSRFVRLSDTSAPNKSKRQQEVSTVTKIHPGRQRIRFPIHGCSQTHPETSLASHSTCNSSIWFCYPSLPLEPPQWTSSNSNSSLSPEASPVRLAAASISPIAEAHPS